MTTLEHVLPLVIIVGLLTFVIARDCVGVLG